MNSINDSPHLPDHLLTSCAIYVRVSTFQQAEHNISGPNQIALASEHAQRLGVRVAHVYSDAKTGRDDNRPEFQRMMDDACKRPRPFDAVIVHSYSRFFRDSFFFEMYRRELERNGIQLISVTQAVSDDSSGNMARQMISLFDEFYSRENAKHVRRAMIENAKQGFWNGAGLPLGYKVVVAEERGSKQKKKLAEEPMSAELVRLIYKLALEGDGDSPPITSASAAT